jgi:hypothetical protein
MRCIFSNSLGMRLATDTWETERFERMAARENNIIYI